MQHPNFQDTRKQSSSTIFLVLTIAPLLFSAAILLDNYGIYTVDAIKGIATQDKIIYLSYTLLVESIIGLFLALTRNKIH